MQFRQIDINYEDHAYKILLVQPEWLELGLMFCS